MCAQLFPSTGGLCKIIAQLNKGSPVGLSNALNPWERKEIEVSCGLFVAEPHSNILCCFLDSLLASVSPLCTHLSSFQVLFLSTSGLSRDTQRLPQFLRLRFVMNGRFTLDLKT